MHREWKLVKKTLDDDRMCKMLKSLHKIFGVLSNTKGEKCYVGWFHLHEFIEIFCLAHLSFI